MSKDPTWNDQPAIGTVFAKLADLYVRALRVDMERRRQSLERMAKLRDGSK